MKTTAKGLMAALYVVPVSMMVAAASAQTLTQVLPVSGGQPLLDTPVFVTSWPGNSSLLVVAERGSGKITLNPVMGVPAPSTIVDLSTEAFLPTSWGDFIGVTGLAFHPEFLTDPKKRYIYVRFNRASSPTGEMVIRRYYIAPGTSGAGFHTNPNQAPQDVYTHPMANSDHGAGTIMFDARPGHEDLLYVPMPDDTVPGGSCTEQQRAQEPSSQLGKLLRIDVSDLGATPLFPVTELARGLRNPYFFSVDRGDSLGIGRGDVWIGDVGDQTTGNVYRYDPLSFPAVVINYAWPWQVGAGGFPWGALPARLPNPPCDTSLPFPEPVPPPPYSGPFLVFSDQSEFNGNWSALIGGYVARTSGVAALDGEYVFATYGRGPGMPGPRVYHVPVTYTTGPPAGNLTAPLGINAWSNNERIHGMGQDVSGAIYIIRVDETSTPPGANGTIFKVI